jgi:endonuclease YncB( thermonuclease family)
LGKRVAVVWNKTDRYDRILGTVIIGLVDVGLEQLRTGAAWYFRRYEADVPEIERHLYATA